MKEKLFKYLKYELKLLGELVIIARQQQSSLVNFNLNSLEEIALSQNELAKDLRSAEEQRIRYLMSWLGITRGEATMLKLSSLEKHFENEQLYELKALRLELKSLITDLHSINTMNRVLANRARGSVQRILSLFTNGANHVCNVRV